MKWNCEDPRVMAIRAPTGRHYVGVTAPPDPTARLLRLLEACWWLANICMIGFVKMPAGAKGGYRYLRGGLLAGEARVC